MQGWNPCSREFFVHNHSVFELGRNGHSRAVDLSTKPSAAPVPPATN